MGGGGGGVGGVGGWVGGRAGGWVNRWVRGPACYCACTRPPTPPPNTGTPPPAPAHPPPPHTHTHTPARAGLVLERDGIGGGQHCEPPTSQALEQQRVLRWAGGWVGGWVGGRVGWVGWVGGWAGGRRRRGLRGWGYRMAGAPAAAAPSSSTQQAGRQCAYWDAPRPRPPHSLTTRAGAAPANAPPRKCTTPVGGGPARGGASTATSPTCRVARSGRSVGRCVERRRRSRPRALRALAHKPAPHHTPRPGIAPPRQRQRYSRGACGALVASESSAPGGCRGCAAPRPHSLLRDASALLS